MRMPESSAWAPAAGARLTASMPVTAARALWGWGGAEPQEVAHDLVRRRLRQVEVAPQVAGVRERRRRHVRLRQEDAGAARAAEVEGEAGTGVGGLRGGLGALGGGAV